MARPVSSSGSWPTRTASCHRRVRPRRSWPRSPGLGTLNGAAFDKAYATMMVKDHHEAVALFKQESASGKNADFKAFAGATLPTLQEHLSMAEKLK
jgi:putative membrane protein